MAYKGKNLIGQRFESLTVVGFDDTYPNKVRRWVCDCDCGNKVNSTAYSLVSGSCKSCSVCSYKKKRKVSDESLISLYSEHGNIWKVGKIVGLCGQSVHERLQKLGIEPSVKRFSDDEKLTLIDKYEEYATRGRLDELSKEMGRPKTSLCKMAKELGLKTMYGRKKKLFDDFENRFKRPDMYKNRVHPKGMKGKKHKKETLEWISEMSKYSYQNMSEEKRAEKVKKMIITKMNKGNLVNPRIKQTWKAEWREIGGNKKYFRSRWEANYARYLQHLKENNQILDWKHEARIFYFDAIKSGEVSFLPDFEVIELSGEVVYHEVKGWMDNRSKIKIERMGIYFPEVKLKVVDAIWFKENSKKMQSMISGWEV